MTWTPGKRRRVAPTPTPTRQPAHKTHFFSFRQTFREQKETHLDDSLGGGYGASDDGPGRDVDTRWCTPVPFARDVHDARV